MTVWDIAVYLLERVGGLPPEARYNSPATIFLQTPKKRCQNDLLLFFTKGSI